MRQTVRLKLRGVVHVAAQKFQDPSSNIQTNPKLQSLRSDGFAAVDIAIDGCPSRRSWELPLSNYPEIARDYIGNPGDVARKRSIGFTVFLQRHYKQIGIH